MGKKKAFVQSKRFTYLIDEAEKQKRKRESMHSVTGKNSFENYKKG
jgi:hypothetical protein